MSSINYADYAGIHSVAAAAAFAIVYVPLLLTYIIKSFRRPSYVHIVLCLFTALRIASFALRALLASSSKYGTNESMFISEMVLYSVGFFGVVYSTYTLILDRQLLALTSRFIDDLPGLGQVIMRLIRNRQVVRIALIIAVIFGVSGATDATSSSVSKQQSSVNNRAISVYIFLAVAAATALQAIILLMTEGNTQYQITSTGYAGEAPMYIRQPTFGARHGAPLLLLISLLLVVREAFYAATAHNASQQDNEKLFYALSAAPELLAVLLLAAPGLVPSRNELPKREQLSMAQRFTGYEAEPLV